MHENIQEGFSCFGLCLYNSCGAFLGGCHERSALEEKRR